ncbi:GNAT family N-acetyltransferase [Kribbella sp. NPDC049227]|uniref:GNAT family N-acetyltransferase n=1 Tax=Kribbella sp. NPDC049227 TaxID=3364113 RepID=UPI0037135D5E
MNLVLRPIAVEDVEALQELIESDPGYTERVTGYPPGPADAQSLLLMRPDGLAEDAKVVLGSFQDGRLVAVADLLRGFPNDHTAYIGLLEVHWNHQGLGLGRVTFDLVQRYVETSWPEVRTLRLAIVATNAHVATAFWLRQGFEPTGEERPYRYDKLETTARLYEKQLPRAPLAIGG